MPSMIRSNSSSIIQERMIRALHQRQVKGTLRQMRRPQQLQHQQATTIDFSSNDYLGLAQSTSQQELVHQRILSWNHNNHYHHQQQKAHLQLGATGSRLLSGDDVPYHELEDKLATLHGQSTSLLFASGYQANLSVVSCLPCDVIVYDDEIHNSLHMGMRWWQQQDGGGAEKRHCVAFRHNSAPDLRNVLQKVDDASAVIVLVESVYSMGGDLAPLQEMLDVAQDYGAQVLVDEAHGLGVYGRSKRRQDDESGEHKPVGTGVLAMHELEHHAALFCSVFTYGKAAGCHGAIACLSSQTHKDYLCNYAYPFIYSTAPPLHTLFVIECAYETMMSSVGDELRHKLFRNVQYFRDEMRAFPMLDLLPSTGPIQALLVPGNDQCTAVCRALADRWRLFPIKSPTVQAGQERIRIVIHAHNSLKQIDDLVDGLQKAVGHGLQQWSRL